MARDWAYAVYTALFLMEEGVEFKYSTSQSVQGIEKSLSPGTCDTDWVLNNVSTCGFVGW